MMETLLVKRLALLLTLSAWLPAAQVFADTGDVPPRGFVPDAQTAVAIARAVLVPIHGRTQFSHEEPLTASRKGDNWLVSGTLQCAPQCLGGVAAASISARNGQILSVHRRK